MKSTGTWLLALVVATMTTGILVAAAEKQASRVAPPPTQVTPNVRRRHKRGAGINAVMRASGWCGVVTRCVLPAGRVV